MVTGPLRLAALPAAMALAAAIFAVPAPATETGQPATAKQAPAKPASSKPAPAAPTAAGPDASAGMFAAAPLAVPPAPVLLALLRGTLSAVNQANITGNYSVLRDLGAPSFRESYSAAALADGFRGWRERRLDLAAILLLDAKLSRPPSVAADGTLRLAGYFPTAPLVVEFDLGFRAVAGNWRLATISVNTSDADITGSIAAAPRPTPARVVGPASAAQPAERAIAIPTPPGDRPRG